MPTPLVVELAALAAAASALGSSTAQEPDPEPAAAPAQASFNPQMSIVTDLRGVLEHPDSDQRRIRLNEIEFGFASDVDPFWSAEAYLGLHRHGHHGHEGKDEGDEYELDIEEAFARYHGFGHGLDAKLGKFKAAIGRTNRNHRDQYEFLDLPFVLQDLFGEEGLAAEGASVSYLFPTAQFHEVTLEVLDPDDGPLFSGSRFDSPVFVGRYRTFFDFSGDLSAQLGFSYANGPTAEASRSHLYGADFTMKFTPGRRGGSWTLEAEAYGSNSGMPGVESTFGGFGALTYEFMPRWFGTVKYDRSKNLGHIDGKLEQETRRAIGFGVTYKATEFQHLRVEWQRVRSEHDSFNLLTLQFQYLIGKHPAHKY